MCAIKYSSHLKIFQNDTLRTPLCILKIAFHSPFKYTHRAYTTHNVEYNERYPFDCAEAYAVL